MFGEKYRKKFFAPIKKQIIKIDKDGNYKIVNISYKIRFIDSFRFMSSLLSNLVDNLSEGLHSDKCTHCKYCLEYIKSKSDQLTLKCFECKKNYKKDFNNELIKRFVNIYKFCNKEYNKFILLLRKGVYPYEYMDGWERFDETSLPDKKAFYSSLSMENITDVDYKHENKIFNGVALKEFNLENLDDYHDL